MFFSPAIQLLDTLGPATLIGLAAILGLLVGSFLNVVIYRLPKMMEADWQAQAAELRQLRKLLPSNGAGMSGGTKPPRDACHARLWQTRRFAGRSALSRTTC